jgi:hypothetical protein
MAGEISRNELNAKVNQDLDTVLEMNTKIGDINPTTEGTSNVFNYLKKLENYVDILGQDVIALKTQLLNMTFKGSVVGYKIAGEKKVLTTGSTLENKAITANGPGMLVSGYFEKKGHQGTNSGRVKIYVDGILVWDVSSNSTNGVTGNLRLPGDLVNEVTVYNQVLPGPLFFENELKIEIGSTNTFVTGSAGYWPV